MNLVLWIQWGQYPTVLDWGRNAFYAAKNASTLRVARKFYIRKNNRKVDSIETGCIVIAHLFPWSNLEKCIM